MKQITQNFKTGEVKLEEVPIPCLKKQGVLVRTCNSLISAGTERMVIEFAQKNLLDKARSRPDLVKQVLNKVKNEGISNTLQSVRSKLETLMPLGYSSSGVVLEVGKGVDELKVGDRVACAGGGCASHAEVNFIPKNLCVKLPDSVSFEEGAFATLGAVALQGVRLAKLTLGEKVVVIGLGLLGQLTVQLVKANGCKVLGIDLDRDKVDLARKLGADEAFVGGELIEAKVLNFTDGAGVDAVIITAAAKDNRPIELAGEISRLKGRVIAVGAVGLNIPRKTYYEKELRVEISMSYGPGRYDSSYEEKGIDYPLPYVRWTEQRNMEAFLDLVAQRKINLDKIISHHFDINKAEQAYAMINEGKEKYLGILLDYPQKLTLAKKVELKRQEIKGGVSRNAVIGFVGAGNYAKLMLLPVLSRLKGIYLKGLATATGISGSSTGKKFGFQYITTDLKEIFQDQDIDTVFVATRHNLHASLVIKALEKGLNVFVEKPLAITEEELGQIEEAYKDSKGILQVGFNRRFSPAALAAKDFFKDRGSPCLINYRVNAGYIPKIHWVSDPVEGGGRIVGEVCHFIDLMIYLTGALPIRVFAETVSSDNKIIIEQDNLSILIKFADGSVGQIGYFSNGDKALPKERIEVFGGGKIFIIDDFKNYETIKNGNRRVKKNWCQDKGQANEVKAFFNAIKMGKLAIPMPELLATTQAAFAIVKSAQSGCPEKV